MSKYTDIMIDIETLGTSVNSVITSIAAVEFNIKTGDIGDKFKVNIDPQSCLDIGLQIDWKTLQWWMLQDKIAMDAFGNAPQNISVAMQHLSQWMATRRMHCVWGNSARFDLGIIENAYNKCVKDKSLWNHRNERCLRTLSALYPEIKKSQPFDGVRHDALDDCIHQIKYACKTLAHIKKSL